MNDYEKSIIELIQQSISEYLKTNIQKSDQIDIIEQLLNHDNDDEKYSFGNFVKLMNEDAFNNIMINNSKYELYLGAVSYDLLDVIHTFESPIVNLILKETYDTPPSPLFILEALYKGHIMIKIDNKTYEYLIVIDEAQHKNVRLFRHFDEQSGGSKTKRVRYESLTVPQLKEKCKLRRIKTTGLKKAELIAALRAKKR